MKIWKLDFDLDEYDNLTTINEMSIEEIRSFDGRQKKDKWETMQVKRLEPEKELPLSDAPGFYSHIPVFNQKAIDVLNQYIVNTSEILPLENDENDFYAINIIEVLDCIDYQKSEYKMFKDGKRIMRFNKYSFDERVIGNTPLFKIKEEPLAYPFVSDDFRNTVIEAGLRGFIFKLVWDSDF